MTLLLCALAPTFGLLLGAISLLGLTTVAGQLLTPLAGDLADETRRGHVVGTVTSGILTGILVSRTISGLVAQFAGWRTIFVAASAVSVLFAFLLYRRDPRAGAQDPAAVPPADRLGLRGGPRERVVRWTLVLSCTGFATFTMFWTALTFLLSSPPFDYPVSVIGLFGLAGLAGAVAAQRAGRLHDKGWSLPATGLLWMLVLLSFGVAEFAGRSVVMVLVVVVLIDAGIQGLNILNQTRIFAVSHEARSRLNTAFVTGNFVGGAIGSAAASVLWAVGGWHACEPGGHGDVGRGPVDLGRRPAKCPRRYLGVIGRSQALAASICAIP